NRTTQVVLESVTSLELAADDVPVVSFGSEVFVSNVQVLNDRTVAATIQPTKNAATGFRDATIRTKKKELVATKAFEVRGQLSVSVVSGSVTQGGRARLVVTNEDGAFDPATVRVFIGDGTEFIDASMKPLATKGASALAFDALFDVGAVGPIQIGAGNFAVDPGGSADAYFFSAPDALKVAKRTPTPVVAGTPLVDQTVDEDMGTLVYTVAGTVGSMIDLTVEGTGAGSQPCYWLTSRSGKARELLKTEGVGTNVNIGTARTLIPFSSATGDLSLVVGDAKGRSGDAADIGWKVQATAVTATAVPEQSGTHSTAAPQEITAASGESFVVSGTAFFDPAAETADDDVYAVEYPAATKLHLSVIHRLPLGKVQIATDANFTQNVTTMAAVGEGDTWLSEVTTPGSSKAWYIRVEGGEWYTTSYALGVRPQ
ncbi:MAG TPA: hypothetical protein VNC41_13555, partial [Acidimicrobiia bacterium]|nr:hypothetical protein [Acidimicrobiia bacterium]